MGSPTSGTRAPSLHQVLALGAAGALLAGGLAARQPASLAAVAFPEVTFDASTLVDGDDDGLDRFVVRVDPSATADTGSGGRGLASLPPDLRRALASFADRGLGFDVAGVDRALLAPSDPAPVDPDRTPLDGIAGVVEATWVDASHVAVAGDLDAAALLALPGVLEVEPDAVVTIASDPHLGELWGLDNQGQVVRGSAGVAGVDVGWVAARRVATGRGAVVAVIDSGVDLDHPDLVERIWRNAGEVCGNGLDDDANGFVDDCSGWDFARGDGTVDDPGADNGHGTHVAGTIAATADNGVGVAGVAPRATIMPLKIFDGGGAPSSRGAAAIRYAVDNGAHVLNLSWGTPAGTPPSSVVADAIAYARDRGVLVVAAAGNEGVDADAAPAYPAALPHDNVVSVAAGTNRDGRASFSNYGRTSVDLFAPGLQILSTVPDGGYGYASGTSMAAPHVSGVAALLVEHLGTTDASTIRRHLLASTVAGRGYTSVATGGRVDAAEALGVGDGVLRMQASGLVGLADGDRARVSLRLEADALPDAPTDLRLTLAYQHDGALRAVVGHPLALGDGTTTATTAEGLLPLVASPLAPREAAALVSGGLALDVAFDVPHGNWAIVAELLDAATLERTGAPQLALFTVAAPPAPPAPEGGGGQPGGGGGDGTGTGDGAPGGGSPGGGIVVVEPGPGTGGGAGGGGGAIVVPAPGGGGGGLPGTIPGSGSPGTPGGGSTGGGATGGGSPGGGSADGGGASGDGSTDGGGSADGGGSPGGGGSTDGGGTSDGGSSGDGTSGDGTNGGGTSGGGSAGGGSAGGGAGGGTSDGGSSGGADDGSARGPVVPDVLPANTIGVVQVRNPGYEGRVHVWFGDHPGVVILQFGDILLVEVPRTTPGTVDVTVHAPDGRTTTYPQALTFVGEGSLRPGTGNGNGAGGNGSDNGSGNGGNGDGNGAGGGNGSVGGVDGTGSGDGGGTTGGDGGGGVSPPGDGAGEVLPPPDVQPDPGTGGGSPGGGGPGPEPEPTTPEDDGPRRPRRGVVGEPMQLANGLTVATFAADEPTHVVGARHWTHRACTVDPCEARSA